nr:serine/arginine repetitive matrix protein 1-like [Macaca fascicularis]
MVAEDGQYRIPTNSEAGMKAPPPSPSLSGTVNQSHPGQETRPRATPSAAAEQRRRAQLHAQGGPQRPGPLLPRRRRGTQHLNPTPQDAPLFSLRFPARRKPRRVFPGSQETAVGHRDGGAFTSPSSLPPPPKPLRSHDHPPRPTACAVPAAAPPPPRQRQNPLTPALRGRPGQGPRAQRRGACASGAAAGRREKGRGERKRSRYLAWRYLAGRHSASTSSSLSGGAPGRGPCLGLRGSRRGCLAKAVPQLLADCAPRAQALPPRAAVETPVRTRLRSAQRRREEPGHSPLARWRRGRPRGGGDDLAAWDSPLGARAGTGATASEPTHLRPPGAGFTAPPGERRGGLRALRVCGQTLCTGDLLT